MTAITTHETEAAAIAAARIQAIEESNWAENGQGAAAALTDDGDTIDIKARDGVVVSEKRIAGWSKDGVVNVSKAIECMVY
jgi:hypothetical protein